jgi:nitroreductase
MDPVLTRRSIRKYQDKPVPDDVLQDLLEAAMAAPSAGDERPWHFVVIRNPDDLAQAAGTQPNGNPLKNAPLAVLVCADLQLLKYEGFWVQDCAASVQNLLIHACAKGLGTVWMGVYPHEERMQPLVEQFGLPEHVIPFALIPVGFPAEQKPPANRYNELRVHQDRW